jgi:hypothetical protein
MAFCSSIPRNHQDPALKPAKPPKGHFFFAGRAFPRITWYKDANLRKLYMYIVILILTNTANGKWHHTFVQNKAALMRSSDG